MSALETYLKRAAETKGTWHKQTVQTIRNYIKTTPEDQIIREIGQIRNQEYLRILWETGLTTRLQTVAINQSKRIEAESKGGI